MRTAFRICLGQHGRNVRLFRADLLGIRNLESGFTALFFVAETSSITNGNIASEFRAA